MNEKIKNLIENLKTQDNRITAIPIFYVQVKERIYGLDDGYGDDFLWIENGEWEEVYDEELIDKLNDIEDNTFMYDFNGEELKLLKNHTKIYFKDQWIDKQPFFTEAAAKRYIDLNSHNLNEPRIYVESGYRNEEWELIREYFLNLKD